MDTAEHPLEFEALAEQSVLPSRVGRVLLLALGAGLLAEVAIHPVVFDRAKPGIGLTVFILIPIIVLLNGRWVIGTGPSSESIVLLLSAGFLAVMITVRASSVLTTWNLMGIAVLLPLAAFSYRGGLAGSSLTQFAAAGLRAGISAPVQTVYLIRDDAPDDWRERMSRSIWQSRSLLRGLAIAALLLLIFGTLLASADAVFANLVEAVFGWDLDAGLFVGSAAVVLTTAWLIAGALRFAAGRQTPREWDRRVGFLSKTEVVTAVAPLVVLSAVFVAIQFTYLFGGVDTIEATGGLTRAEYYRQGFFQLVVVAGLVALLILSLDWAHRAPERPADRRISALYAALIVLTGFMVASALARLVLYVDSFGLTELRVYTTAFVVWLAALLVLLLFTVVRGRRRWFATGALVAGIAVGAVLNLVNPDALIARVNLDRHLEDGLELDMAYLADRLSADAVPVLVDRLDEIADPCVRREATAAPRAAVEPAGDWRSFHFARDDAAAAVAGVDPSLFRGCDG